MPKGKMLACIDGDTLNCDPSNWKIITKAENALRNSGVIGLPDKVIASWIAGYNNKELKAEILKQPELIELKRTQIKLNRKIRSLQK